MDRTINELIIHCSDSPDGRGDTSKDIELWHKQRALGGIGKPPEPWDPYLDKNGIQRFTGYHWIILHNGVAEQGRPEEFAGCHCIGHNKFSIGLCWIGTSAMSDSQYVTLIRVAADIMLRYNLKVTQVHGHCEFSKKTCPNMDMDKFKTDLNFFNQNTKEC
jgi:N-acetylmuramoyl-L-alanine amidase